MSVPTAPTDRDFCHLAMLYAGAEGFLAGTVPFLRTGLSNDEPMLVVVGAPKIAALRGALGPDSDRVHFADMAEVGHNPAWIIPAWRRFLDEHGGGTRPVRGIGEPIFPDRSADELVECQRHESLLNVAFEGSGRWSLLCPYDTTALPAEVIDEATRSHPVIEEDGMRRASPTVRSLHEMAAPFDAPLPAPNGVLVDVVFDDERGLQDIRRVIARHAARAGLDEFGVGELVLAVHEAAANSLRHGGASCGTFQMWVTDTSVVCEVRDAGQIDDPLVGREQPDPDALRGRGMWMVNRLCDLVQVRAYPDGNVVRLHKALPA